MIERIVSLSDENARVYSFYGKGQDRPFYQAETKEIITRCKDCRYRNPDPSEAIWEEDGKVVRGFPEKSAYLCNLIHRAVPPSGFCKWGLRRKDVQ